MAEIVIEQVFLVKLDHNVLHGFLKNQFYRSKFNRHHEFDDFIHDLRLRITKLEISQTFLEKTIYCLVLLDKIGICAPPGEARTLNLLIRS